MIPIEDITLVLRRTEKRKSHVTGHKQPPMFQILPRAKCGETRGEGGVRYGALGFISLSAVVGASYFRVLYLQFPLQLFAYTSRYMRGVEVFYRG